MLEILENILKIARWVSQMFYNCKQSKFRELRELVNSINEIKFLKETENIFLVKG